MKKSEYIDLYLNRYQIQIYDTMHQMIHSGVYEGFSFEEACKIALTDLKSKMDLSRIPYPLRFFSSSDPNRRIELKKKIFKSYI
jgi:hypothetical protein